MPNEALAYGERMLRTAAAALCLTLIPALGCSAATPPAATPDGPTGGPIQSDSSVQLKVTRVVQGLDHPWDVQPIGQGRLLISERAGRLSVWKKGKLTNIPLPSGLVWAEGETGLMGLAVDPDFRDNRRFYTCLGHTTAGGHDVRVIAWELGKPATSARRVKTLISGFPTSSGRHGGCRLLVLQNGALLVGTGDAAIGTNPQDKTSLGGKTLMLNRFTGAPWPANPFVNASNHNQRYVHTYGHRNVQGLAQRSDGTLWSAEHGPDRDDEVNLLVNGGNYGWNPVPGYNESVPMTDQGLPGKQIGAKWSSGFPTVATSGSSFVQGSGWGWYGGTLAVAALKAGELFFMKFDTDGNLLGVRSPVAMQQYGRLRAVTVARDGSLLITTDNGGDDAVLRVRPVSG